jgi:hypothetical protein
MNRFISILILTGILLQTFSKVIIYVNYEINLDYIVQTFCVNKNDPSKHCDGKCHLIKQLQEEEKQESLPGNSRDERPELPLFSESCNSFLFNSYASKEYIFTEYQLSKTISPVFPFFHPPMDFNAFLNSVA